MRLKIHLYIMLLCLGFGCRESYEPNITDADLNILVIEGSIETTGEESSIQLSRTRNMYSSGLDNQQDSGMPEHSTGAPPPYAQVLTIEGEDGQEFDFYPNQEDPTHFSFQVSLEHSQAYRVRIELQDGAVYQSDWMKAIVSPEIEELGFIQRDEEVFITATTTGNDNAAYFFWEFEETWIYRPPFITTLKYHINEEEKGEVIFRGNNERIDRCWSDKKSSGIVLEAAGKYQSHQIHQKRIHQILNGSEKLMERYSILVRQWAISQEAYTFWETLRKNTTDIGDIFGPVPSLIGSNFRRLDDPESPVIGFIHFGQSSTRRLYINRFEVHPWNVDIPDYYGCYLNTDTIPITEIDTFFSSGGLVPVQPVYCVDCPSEGPVGYTATTQRCADCTLRGTNQAPDFWDYGN